MSDAELVLIAVVQLAVGVLIGRMWEMRYHMSVWSRGFAQGMRLHHRSYCTQFGTRVADHVEHKPDTMPEVDWVESASD